MMILKKSMFGYIVCFSMELMYGSEEQQPPKTKRAWLKMRVPAEILGVTRWPKDERCFWLRMS